MNEGQKKISPCEMVFLSPNRAFRLAIVPQSFSLPETGTYTHYYVHIERHNFLQSCRRATFGTERLQLCIHIDS